MSDGVTLSMVFGRIYIWSWLEWRGDECHGVGRIKEVDGDGKVVRDETTDTGVVMRYE